MTQGARSPPRGLVRDLGGLLLVTTSPLSRLRRFGAPLHVPESAVCLQIDWGQLREDLAADEKALDEFSEWAKSSAGRTATEYELDLTREQLVPYRPWYGASTSEMTVLRIATELAPGGLIGDGLAHLDEANTSTVLIAVAEVAEGRYIKPDWADI